MTLWGPWFHLLCWLLLIATWAILCAQHQPFHPADCLITPQSSKEHTVITSRAPAQEQLFVIGTEFKPGLMYLGLVVQAYKPSYWGD